MVLIHEIGVRFSVGSPIRELFRSLEKDMKREFETMWVLRKDENTHHLIKAHRFNPEFHKKLFLRNIIKESVEKISSIKIDINNPWLVGFGITIFTFILSMIFLR